MDANISGEELLAKARKPYTITKQRERWTDDEHDRFLEALRLYGRAWQRIEEYIGTKTAVQIRSHAQKFFTKLEKEAQAKGIPVCQALDIEVPPPRPKRKPTTPYPRKPGNGTSSSHVSSAKDTKLVSSASSSRCTQASLDLEKPPFAEANGDQKTSAGKENQDDNCSGITTRPHEAHCSSISSVNKYPLPKKVVTPGNPCTFMESEQSLRKQASADNGANKASNMDNSYYSKDNTVQDISRADNGDGVNGQPHSMKNYPSHFPMDVVNGNMATCSQNPPGMISQDFMFHPMGEVHGHSGSFTNPATSSDTTSQHQDNVLRSFHQAFPAFHPAFTPACHTQDDYRTFSNLILSTLLQNPAAHAAATFAASFWPYANVGSSGDSSTSTNQTDGTFPTRQMTSPPSIAAIAAATVAAATAWWAAHGLLPVCAPFTCHPIPTTAVPPQGSGETTMTETGKNETTTTTENAQLLDGKQSTAQEDQNMASKSPASSSDDSEETGITKLNSDSKIEKEEVVAVHDSNNTQNKRPVDRSSCGSNTPSGSDAETDALEKVEKDKEDVKETDANQSAIELSNRRIKIRDNNNPTTDSWKEVSEGGRLAFQALFARGRLPQSFSPPQDVEKERQNQNDMSMSLVPNNNNQDSEVKGDQERLVMMSNGPGKNLKTRQTGFKPYKRCSMEVKESQVGDTNNQSDEKVCKRIRLEGEAST